MICIIHKTIIFHCHQAMTMQEGSVDDENRVHTLWYAISAGGAIILDNSCRARTWSDLSNSSASSNNNAIMALIYIYIWHTTCCMLCVWKTPFHIIYIIVLSAYAFYSPEACWCWGLMLLRAAYVWDTEHVREHTGGEILIGRVVKRQKVTLWMRTQANTKRNLNGFINTL
jgi:hypothetical protein